MPFAARVAAQDDRENGFLGDEQAALRPMRGIEKFETRKQLQELVRFLFLNLNQRNANDENANLGVRVCAHLALGLTRGTEEIAQIHGMHRNRGLLVDGRFISNPEIYLPIETTMFLPQRLHRNVISPKIKQIGKLSSHSKQHSSPRSRTGHTCPSRFREAA